MRGILCGLCWVIAFSSSVLSQTLTTVILPRYIEGLNGTNSNRIPFAYRVRLDGLLPDSTYRYTNQIVTSSDGPTTSGAGNCIFATGTGDFFRTSSPGLSTAGSYGTFTVNDVGSYEGWFITEPTGNARFIPGHSIFMRIMLNNGASGTSVAMRLTTSDSVCVLKLDPAAGDSTGTGLRCSTAATPKDFVFLYDNREGSGRPLSGTFLESDGSDNSAANNYAAFYANSVNGVTGAFGVVLPNALPGGVRRVERRSFSGGALIAAAVDSDGIWPSGANTVNPSGGTSEIILTGDDVDQLATGVTERGTLPNQYILWQSYPNPCNPTARIAFAIPRESSVKLEVFNLLGERVTTLLEGRRSAGRYETTFDATGLSSGVYICRLSADGVARSMKLTVMR
jgi:hypothetical protein